MKKLLSVVIALMMMVTFVFAEEAAPAEVKTLYAGVLTVGCEAGYPPFEMVADDGESVVGLDMDIMAAVAEKLGLQMQVVTTSFDGIFDGIGVNYDVVCSAVTITLTVCRTCCSPALHHQLSGGGCAGGQGRGNQFLHGFGRLCHRCAEGHDRGHPDGRL